MGSDPNSVGLDDVAAAGFVGSIVYTTIEIVHTKRSSGLSGETKAWLALVLSLVFVAGLYIAIAVVNNSLFPFAKVITLAWQAYGHSQGQHNITSAMGGGGGGASSSSDNELPLPDSDTGLPGNDASGPQSLPGGPTVATEPIAPMGAPGPMEGMVQGQ